MLAFLLIESDYHWLHSQPSPAVSSPDFDSVFIAQRQPLLRTLLRMVHNPSVAEELVQETYLKVSNVLAERRVEHLEPFLFQAGRNLALDYLRRVRMQSRSVLQDVPEDVLLSVPSSETSVEEGLHARRLLQRLDASLAGLTERQRSIFVLSRLQGLSHAEIAEQLQVSLSTVQKDLKLVMAICVAVIERLDADG